MKKLNLALLTITLSAVGASTSVFAADGTITVNGKVVTSTCTLSGSSGASGTGSNVALTLNTVRNDAFNAVGSVQAQKSFTLSVTNSGGSAACDAVTIGGIKNITLSGTSGTDYDGTNKTYLINQDTTAPATKDVYVQILGTDLATPIDFSSTKQLEAPTITGSGASTTGTYTLAARYISNKASPAAQTVLAKINYTLEYN